MNENQNVCVDKTVRIRCLEPGNHFSQNFTGINAENSKLERKLSPPKKMNSPRDWGNRRFKLFQKSSELQEIKRGISKPILTTK